MLKDAVVFLSGENFKIIFAQNLYLSLIIVKLLKLSNWSDMLIASACSMFGSHRGSFEQFCFFLNSLRQKLR